jgi:exodeoxyribonuclease VII large subunit
MDLFAFCDETLCRTMSMLRVPVIASVGHHTDRTLIDDVAAVSCSTPTHAAEAAVPVHCGAERERLLAAGVRLEAAGRRAVLARAQSLTALSRAPAAHVERHRARLHQHLREIRASASRGVAGRRRALSGSADVLGRRAAAGSGDVARAGVRALDGAAALERSAAQARARRHADLDRLALALAAHDPQRTLERGYALVEGPDGRPVTSAAAARTLDRMTLRLHDGALGVRADD